VRTTRSPGSRASSTQRKMPGGLSLILSSGDVAGHEASGGSRRADGLSQVESVGRDGFEVVGLPWQRFLRSCSGSWSAFGSAGAKRIVLERVNRLDRKRFSIRPSARLTLLTLAALTLLRCLCLRGARRSFEEVSRLLASCGSDDCRRAVAFLTQRTAPARGNQRATHSIRHSREPIGTAPMADLFNA
jgi:hypothetical protein